MILLAVTAPSPLWYISRGAGFVGLALLGAIAVLGLMTASQTRLSARLPRFITVETHRSLSLLAVVVLSIHIITAMMDPFVPITLLDVFVPFVSTYRPLWIGFGAIAIDIGIAVLVTSLIRIKMKQRTWKIVHLLAYIAFFASIVHGLGTGSDSRFLLGKVFYLVVGAAFLITAWIRILDKTEAGSSKRILFGALAVIAPLSVVGFSVIGPFKTNWAKRANAGISGVFSQSTVTTPIALTKNLNALSSVSIPSNFTSNWSGSITESAQNSQGELALRLMGPLGSLKGYDLVVTLVGVPADQGLSMSSSIVEVVSKSGNVAYNGQVTSLNNGAIGFSIKDNSGQSVTLSASVNAGQTSFTGQVGPYVPAQSFSGDN